MTDMLHRDPSGSHQPKSALETLARQLKNGEITEKQFMEQLGSQETESTADSGAIPEQPDDTSDRTSPKISRRGLLGGLLAVGGLTALGGGVAYYNANRNPSTPGSVPTPKPTDSISPSPTPSSVETTPSAPKLPFDSEEVAILRDKTAAEFYENYRLKPRIQYALSAMHGEIDGRSPFGHELCESRLGEELPTGELLSDYNPFKENSLTEESDPQHVMNAYLYGWLYAVVHKNSEEGKKMLGAVVRDPSSAAFRDAEGQVEKHAGITDSLIKTVRSRNYQELRSRREVVDGKTQLTIITLGGIKNVFTFEPIPHLAESNENTDDDGEKVGIWLLESSELAKVTIE